MRGSGESRAETSGGEARIARSKKSRKEPKEERRRFGDAPSEAKRVTTTRPHIKDSSLGRMASPAEMRDRLAREKPESGRGGEGEDGRFGLRDYHRRGESNNFAADR